LQLYALRILDIATATSIILCCSKVQNGWTCWYWLIQVVLKCWLQKLSVVAVLIAITDQCKGGAGFSKHLINAITSADTDNKID